MCCIIMVLAYTFPYSHRLDGVYWNNFFLWPDTFPVTNSCLFSMLLNDYFICVSVWREGNGVRERTVSVEPLYEKCWGCELHLFWASVWSGYFCSCFSFSALLLVLFLTSYTPQLIQFKDLCTLIFSPLLSGKWFCEEGLKYQSGYIYFHFTL